MYIFVYTVKINSRSTGIITNDRAKKNPFYAHRLFTVVIDRSPATTMSSA